MTVRKIGLDFHGVIDIDPEYFSKFTEVMASNCIEIHIITGAEDTPVIRKQLEDWGIKYHTFASIVEFRRQQGEKVWYKNGLPWMNDDAWDTAKADYCYAFGIDLHIDDTLEYGRWFRPENKFLYWRK